jgi:hypothetical protein
MQEFFLYPVFRLLTGYLPGLSAQIPARHLGIDDIPTPDAFAAGIDTDYFSHRLADVGDRMFNTRRTTNDSIRTNHFLKISTGGKHLTRNHVINMIDNRRLVLMLFDPAARPDFIHVQLDVI